MGFIDWLFGYDKDTDEYYNQFKGKYNKCNYDYKKTPVQNKSQERIDKLKKIVEEKENSHKYMSSSTRNVIFFNTLKSFFNDQNKETDIVLIDNIAIVSTKIYPMSEEVVVYYIDRNGEKDTVLIDLYGDVLINIDYIISLILKQEEKKEIEKQQSEYRKNKLILDIVTNPHVKKVGSYEIQNLE